MQAKKRDLLTSWVGDDDNGAGPALLPVKSPRGHGAAKPKYADKKWVWVRVRDTRTGRVSTEERMIQYSTYYEGTWRYFMYDGDYDCQQFDGFQESEIVRLRDDANDTAEGGDEMVSNVWSVYFIPYHNTISYKP